MLSHDWPGGIPDFGDKEWLFRKKDLFEADHNSGKLGNPSGMKLIYVCFLVIFAKLLYVCILGLPAQILSCCTSSYCFCGPCSS